MENTTQNIWHQSVDFYCERLSDAFWAEPINAISNIFFIITAIMAFRLWQKSASRNWDSFILTILMSIVGIGSFVFHTIATRWAGLADVLPIAVFIHFGLGVFLYRLTNAGLMATMLGVFVFGLYSLGIQKVIPPEIMNRSGQYFAAATLLAGMTLWCYLRKIPSAKYFLAALATFVVSLAFRSNDMAVCSMIPIGIHYMWHALNAVVMYLVFKGIISYSRVSVQV